MKLDDLLASLPPTTPGPSPGLHLPDLDPSDLVSLFGRRLREVDGVGHGPLPASLAGDLVVSIFSEAGVEDYLGWEDPGLPGIHQKLAAAGARRRDDWVPKQVRPRMAHQQTYASISGGLTGADAGLAESGSIVLRSGPGRPRMASLLPAVHVAVLSIARLVRTLAHYAADHPAAPAGVSNLVVITGPSRSGDIEQQLNLGVHGPRHLHVVLVN